MKIEEFTPNVRAILGSMPFSQEIENWVLENKDVQQSLKLLYPERFVSFAGTSVVDYPHGVQLVGIFSVDSQLNSGLMVKQDFIIREAGTFILHTTLPSDKTNLYSTRVRPVNSISEEKFPGIRDKHHPQGTQGVPPELHEHLRGALGSASQMSGKPTPPQWLSLGSTNQDN